MSQNLPELSWEEVISRLKMLPLDSKEFDLVVGIERGGIVPASLLAYRLEKPLISLGIRLYEDGPRPPRRYSEPRLVREFKTDLRDKRILLVDDLSRSGETMLVARKILQSWGAVSVKTVVIVGKADYSCYPEFSCVVFPWDQFKRY